MKAGRGQAGPAIPWIGARGGVEGSREPIELRRDVLDGARERRGAAAVVASPRAFARAMTSFLNRFPRNSLSCFRRRKIGQIYLCSRNFIGGLSGASEIFLTPRKTTV